MNTESVTLQTAPRNTNPHRSKSTRRSRTRRECSRCHYALYPNTGNCSNFECPRYHRQSGAMTIGQIMHEFLPPELFHGRRWGLWTLDSERWCLAFEAHPLWRDTESTKYLGYFGHYEVDLERIRDSAALADWIFQIREKAWATSCVLRDLLNALDDVIDVQASLCGGAMGGGRGGSVIANPASFLRKRVETIGKRVTAGGAA
jgi:hypothetical protein